MREAGIPHLLDSSTARMIVSSGVSQGDITDVISDFTQVPVAEDERNGDDRRESPTLANSRSKSSPSTKQVVLALAQQPINSGGSLSSAESGDGMTNDPLAALLPILADTMKFATAALAPGAWEIDNNEFEMSAGASLLAGRPHDHGTEVHPQKFAD
jgi:hypothetical protein